MRQLTVGSSESPHVTHPSTSNCEILYLDILYLLNCLFIDPVRQASYAHWQTVKPKKYSKYGQEDYARTGERPQFFI